MRFISDRWVLDTLNNMPSYEPDGYTTHWVRDWRWLWLRRRPVQVPYWNPVKISLRPTDYSS